LLNSGILLEWATYSLQGKLQAIMILDYFVQTITPEGEQRLYWGKDFPRALEEAGAKVGDSITVTRVASKPVTVEEIQEQPDGSRQTVRIDAKRGQ
jgi:hypothetical protein